MIPARLLSPRLWLGSISALAVAWLVVDDMRPRGPGPLASVHDRHPDLDSRGDCEACHGESGQSLAAACSECHEDIGAHIQGGLGLHGTLDAAVSSQCALCHSEHHGNEFQLVNERSFFIAGVADPAQFEHELVGFDMRGRHLELDCTQCHEHSGQAVLEPGQQRFLGLKSDCRSCHEDPHEGRMGRACASCHGQESFDRLSEFDHSESFELRGAHAEARCFDCHEPDSPHSVETLSSAQEPAGVRQCVRCHETPHSRVFGTGIASLLSALPGNSCGSCHDPQDASFRELAGQLSIEQHATTGFALDAPHAGLECAQCHAPGAPKFERRYPGRAADACQACHDDPHAGQFESGPFADGCLDCHSRLAFTPHEFTLQKHARSSMALSGSHLELECRSCHQVDERTRVRVFEGTASQCAACHRDVHAGFFGAHAEASVSARAGDCATCHETAAFSGPGTRAFEHGLFTGFALQGAHAQNECATCHGRGQQPDAEGRHLGHVADHFGATGTCADCHEDPHEGHFDAENRPREVEGRTDCARCHVETSFRLFESNFRHARWTGFALDGSHGKIQCTDCHEALKTVAPDGRTWSRARGKECVDCHADPHAGQFEQDGRSECSSCHSPKKGFGDLHFDHDQDTRFPLDQSHAGLECAACHRRATIEQVQAVRYKPMGRECVDCHGVTKSRLRPKRAKGGGR